MNLIFFYASNKPINKSVSLSELEQPATNTLAVSLQSDGVFVLLDLLAATGVVDHIYCIVDSRYGNGILRPTTTTTIYCVPNINFVYNNLIKPNDILFFRGGFRIWLPLLDELLNAPFWKLYYRANTNHKHWPFWDIILNDLYPDDLYNDQLEVYKNAILQNKLAIKRLIFPYHKPVNEYIFKPIIPAQHKYDIMLGASHIHAKKGQHIALQACNVLAVRDKKFMDLKYIMPGGMIRCGTNAIINQSWPIGLYKPGFVKRSCLARLMNNTKLFIHAGPGGQNDRSVLEALACGIPVVIKYGPKHYSPWLKENDYVTICDSNSIEDWANIIEKAWNKIPSNYNEFNEYRERLVKWYWSVNGLWDVAFTRMKHLITALKKANPGDFNKVIENLEEYK